MKQTNPAPLKILEAVRAGLDGGAAAGYKAEREKFSELVATSKSKGLVSLYSMVRLKNKLIQGRHWVFSGLV